MKRVFLFLALMASLVPSNVSGALIGEPAPPLVIKEWIKGQPVQIKPGTNFYVVEIWITPSRGNQFCITNLNRLQERFKTNGLVVVGVSDESAERIKEFVQREGSNIQYVIAADDQRKTALSYMNAVNQRGVPYAFVVGTNGTVLWHGSPLAGLNKALDLITSGQYDLDQVKKSQVAGHQMEQYLGLARRRDFRAKQAGLALLASRTNDVQLLSDMAYEITTAPKLVNRDLALAGEAIDQAEKLSATNQAPVMGVRAVWLFISGKQDIGMSLATQALNSAQSPVDKNRIQMLLRTMEAHLAVAKTNQVNTNQSNTLSRTEHVSPANTNTPNVVPGKDSAAKP